MRLLKRTALIAGAVGLALTALGPAQAAGKHLVILESAPDLAFPFFVHMMNQMKAEAAKLGDIEVIESDGQRSSTKRGRLKSRATRRSIVMGSPGAERDVASLAPTSAAPLR